MALDNLEQTDSFFQKILHHGLQDNTIKNVILLKKEPATKKGENFLSCLTRFTLNYDSSEATRNDDNETKAAHLILKEEPSVSPEILQNIRHVFERERAILAGIVPKIEAFVGRRLCPKVFYTSIEPQMIIMEDLAALSFKNIDRKLGLNLDQTLMILESLADLHAGSVLLYEQNPEWLKSFSRKPVYSKQSDTFFRTIGDTLTSLGNKVRSWPGKKFVSIPEKLEIISLKVAERWREITKYDDDEFCVLNHGDLWSNNIMFRNDESGKLQDLRLIDYQLCVWSSPALDLCHFLASGPELSLKGTNDDAFLERYLTRLSSTMEQIGCASKSPKMEDLKKSMQKRRMMSLISGLVYFPKMVAEEGELENIEDILEKEKDDIDIMKNPRVHLTVEKMLPIWNERGYLESIYCESKE